MKKMLLIYNPLSGKGLIKSNLAGIIETFSTAGYEMIVYPTKAALDAARMVSARAGEFDVIACCGGDGTLDEVVTGLMQNGSRRPVAYIPSGSTNDFAASLGLSKNMEQTARDLVRGEEFVCDLGRFNDGYFVYVAAFGSLAEVSFQTPQEMKNTIGHTAYLLEAMRRMGTWKNYNLRIRSEEYTEEGEFVFGMITNSDSVGGIKGIAGEHVELNDGLFEVMLVHAPQSLLDWQEILTAILTHERNGKVVMFRTRHLVVESDEPMAWTRDGENGGFHRRVEVENLQGAFSVLVQKRNGAPSSNE